MKPASKHYRMSPSFLNKFSGWLNAAEMWDRYWGESAEPPHTPEEFEAMQLKELLAYINNEPQEPNEAADRGTCLNEIIDVLTGATPREDVRVLLCTEYYEAHKEPYTFKFDKSLIYGLCEVYEDAISQYHLLHTYDLSNGDRVTLHGFADYIFPTEIWDMKTTSRYAHGNYDTNWQRKIYPVVAVDSGAMTECDSFTFDVQVCREQKGIIVATNYREYYDVNIEDFRAEALSFIETRVVPALNEWEAAGLIPNNNMIKKGE